MPSTPAVTDSPKRQVKPNSERSRKGRDWGQIEQLYRTGLYTDVELGDRVGLTAAAIRAQAKKLDWKRDLSARVKTAIAAKLIAEDASAINPDAETESELVDAAAEQHARRVRQHLIHASRLRAVSDRMTSLVEGVLSDDPELRAESAGKLFQTPGDSLTGAVKTLALLLKGIQESERKSLRMDDASAPLGSSPDNMSSEDRVNRICLILAKVGISVK